MCLAVPAEVISVLPEGRAKVRLGGIVKEISTVFAGPVCAGDYVVVHVGFALGLIDKAEAERTLQLMQESAA